MGDRAVTPAGRSSGRRAWPRALSLLLAAILLGFPAAGAAQQRVGAWVDVVLAVEEPSDAAAISRLEAQGGVRRFEEQVKRDAALAESLARAHEEQRRLRPALDSGIAGSRSERRLKCLHAHAAFALARPGYLLGERILVQAGERWCPDARCSAATRAG